MTAADLFRRVVTALDAAGIPYMLTGSFASSYHGMPRATQDIDVVVELPEIVAKELYLAVSSDFYADEEMILDAIRCGLSFNLIHLESGYKFDLFVAGRHPLGDDTHVQAVIRTSLCRRATTKPVPASGCAIAARGHASATLAVETYGTCAHRRAASTSIGASREAATCAGTARMSARA